MTYTRLPFDQNYALARETADRLDRKTMMLIIMAIAGDRGRRRSKFVLFRRQKANGVVRSRHYKVKTPQTASAMMDSQQHSISYTLSRNQAVIVEYGHDPGSDLFQIGRSSESPIDFVVMDTVPGNRVQDKISSQSTISRFACRIIAEREPST